MVKSLENLASFHARRVTNRAARNKSCGRCSIVSGTVGRRAYRWFYGTVPFAAAIRFNIVKGLLLAEQAPLLLCTAPLVGARSLVDHEREPHGTASNAFPPRGCRFLPTFAAKFHEELLHIKISTCLGDQEKEVHRRNSLNFKI